MIFGPFGILWKPQAANRIEIDLKLTVKQFGFPRELLILNVS